MKTLTSIPAALLCRFKWIAYRCSAELGVAGLAACGVLLVAVAIQIGIVAPAVRGNDARLAQITSGKKAYEDALTRMAEASRETSTASESGGDLWNVLEKYRLSSGEVKYRHFPGKKNSPDQARNQISLPSTGEYRNFRAALKDLDALPDVTVDAFSLSRKTYADRLLAIDMTLSVGSSTENLRKGQVKE